LLLIESPDPARRCVAFLIVIGPDPIDACHVAPDESVCSPWLFCRLPLDVIRPTTRFLPANPCFLAALAAILAGSVTVSSAQPLFERGQRVLFQGDSITDMARGRTDDPNHILGHSYVFLIAARQAADFPGQRVTFINRGVSGDQLGDLVARWPMDTLALKPDVLSILVGVNDVSHAFRDHQPFSVGKYEETYDHLLAATIAGLPKVKLVLCEPFFAPGLRTAEHAAEWEANLKALHPVLERLAAKYHAPVVHFQRTFDDAFQRAPVTYWIWDGIHPTYAGQQLLADEWQRAYRAFYGPPAGPADPPAAGRTQSP
jgi:lysophospholipase L1-like esterase